MVIIWVDFGSLIGVEGRHAGTRLRFWVLCGREDRKWEREINCGQTNGK